MKRAMVNVLAVWGAYSLIVGTFFTLTPYIGRLLEKLLVEAINEKIPTPEDEYWTHPPHQ